MTRRRSTITSMHSVRFSARAFSTWFIAWDCYNVVRRVQCEYAFRYLGYNPIKIPPIPALPMYMSATNQELKRTLYISTDVVAFSDETGSVKHCVLVEHTID